MTSGIFIDFDNTMMETEKHSLPSLIARFNELYGDKLDAPLTYPEFTKHFHGLAREALSVAMSGLYGFHVDTDALFAQRDIRVMLFVRDIPGGIVMAPHMIDVLQNLRAKGWVVALVTNNTLQRCFSAMRYADNKQGAQLGALLSPHFYEAGFVQKPDPDVYLRAIEESGSDAKKSVAIEDSPAGVTAAVAAGLTCFGFTGFSHEPAMLAAKLIKAGARDIFHSWDMLPELMRTNGF